MAWGIIPAPPHPVGAAGNAPASLDLLWLQYAGISPFFFLQAHGSAMMSAAQQSHPRALCFLLTDFC